MSVGNALATTFKLLILLFIIFGAYFILNYNAYKLYSVGAKGENFDVKNTLMFITKNESYIQFGNITDSDGSIPST